MKSIVRQLALLILASPALLHAQSNPAGTTTSTAFDPAGLYLFVAQTPNGDIPGRIQVDHAADGYSGTITPEGMSPAYITRVTLDGSALTILATTSDGPVQLNLKVVGDSVLGTFVAPGGDTGPIRARKLWR